MPHGQVLGVDLGGTKLLALLVGPGGTPGEEMMMPSPRNGEELVAAVALAAGELCKGAPEAIGVGIPGLVDVAGAIRFAPNLKGVGGLQLRDAIAGLFGNVVTWAGNDATAACWAEHASAEGAATGSGEVVMVTLGTGIGGGMISGGRLVEGQHRYAGELGHMVVDPDGPECPCGRRGCWERFASGDALGVAAREAAIAGRAPALVELAGGDPTVVRGEHATTAASRGDIDALRIIGEFARWVSLGLANLANMLDPEVIVVGGGLVEAGDVLLDPVRRAFAEMVEAPTARADLRIVGAALGNRAGAIGAGMLAAAAKTRARN